MTFIFPASTTLTDTKYNFHTAAQCSNTSDELLVAYKLHIVPRHSPDQVNKLAFSKKSPQRPWLCSCHSLPFRKLFLPSTAKPTFQSSGSISWFPFLCFHSTLYLPSSQLLPHYPEIIYLCVCLPSYRNIPRGQGTCLTHLPTPRQNVAQQSTSTGLNCNPVRLASSPLSMHPAHSTPSFAHTSTYTILLITWDTVYRPK